MRAAFFGDCHTWGANTVGVEYCWPTRLCEIHKFSQSCNYGETGMTSGRLVARLQEDARSQFEQIPFFDYVFLSAGTKDVILEIPTDETVRNLSLAYDLAGEKAVLCTVIPYNRLSDPTPILSLNDWIRGEADRRGLLLADFFRALEEPVGSGRMVHTDDGLHPNHVGHLKMAECIDLARKE